MAQMSCWMLKRMKLCSTEILPCVYILLSAFSDSWGKPVSMGIPDLLLRLCSDGAVLNPWSEFTCEGLVLVGDCHVSLPAVLNL